jgi:HK97 gp10 family phage protein
VSDIFGINEVIAALEAVSLAAQETAKTIVKRSEAVVESEAKKQSTGSHKRGAPTTSRPGEPPDVVSGTLRRSIKSDPVSVNGWVAKGSVYPTAVYARIQELGGTTGHSTLPARPYMRPAYELSLPKMTAIAAEEWAKAIRI